MKKSLKYLNVCKMNHLAYKYQWYDYTKNILFWIQISDDKSGILIIDQGSYFPLEIIDPTGKINLFL